MPKTISVTGYEFHELSDRAKDRVRQWCWESDDHWWENVYEDFVLVAKCLGFEVETHERNCRRKGIWDPDIWFEDNYGWRAGFNARWRLLDATKAGAKIKDYLNDELLVRLATVLEEEIAKFAIVGLEAIMREGNVFVKIVGDEHGIKDGCDSIEWTSDYNLSELEEAAAVSLGVTVEATAKDLARWLAKQLEAEADYRQSEECVKETCDANEWLFDESGRLIS